MKRLTSLQLAVASIVLIGGVGTARAQSDDYAAPIYGISTTESYEQRIATLESQLASMRNSVGNYSYSGGGCDAGCGCVSSCCDADCGCNDCCGGCCSTGGVYARVEALLFSYHRADGSRVGSGPNEQVNPSFNLAPRLTVGYQGPEGTGIRVRWFDYNHNERTVANIAGDFISVDTFNIDIELFDEIAINRNWSVEVSGGYRFNNFSEVMVDNEGAAPDIRAVFGTSQGAIIGMEAKRQFGWGTLYGGFNGSILFGNRNLLQANPAPAANQLVRLGDVVQSIWEIRVGYENSWMLANGALAHFRLGVEMQQWENFSSAFDFTTSELFWDGQSDVGFTGVVAGFGISR